MRIFVLMATYELRVSRKSHLRDHPSNIVYGASTEPRGRIPPFMLMRVVKTTFGHIPSIEQSKRGVFITLIYNIFSIFYGTSEKFEAFYSVNCILMSKLIFMHLLSSMC
jgi:hypothetical protein